MTQKSPECKTCSNADSCDEQTPEQQAVCERLRKIRHTILVLSGKGGVGKSTVATSLACGLARQGLRTGLMDVDVHGPSVPKMLGLEEAKLMMAADGVVPAESDGVKVISISLMLREPGEAVIWRGPMKMSVIRQFIKDVQWGELDALVVDCPPGTGDEPLSVAQLIPHADGAVIVTTPQEVALTAVRRSVRFCRQLNMPVLGIVENMGGILCPDCGKRIDVFGTGGGERLAGETGVPFLGGVPLDPRTMQAAENGNLQKLMGSDSPGAEALRKIVDKITQKLKIGE